MKVDARLDVASIDEMGFAAHSLEQQGYSGLWSSETAHDPFLPLIVAAEHTRTIQLGCAIAVAFARNPMTVANLTHDLQTYSRGRFTLGLGTQIKAHIERRFSMPWSDPTSRLEEFIGAVRAILTSWETGEPLNFAGKYYRHTLMTSMFKPEPHGYGLPRIIMAGVGMGMIEAAGRTGDGVLVHGFSTPSYLRDAVLPAVQRGLAACSKSRDEFEISCRGFLATGRDEEELKVAMNAIRARIAFYGSTPAYRPVLAHHGWGDLADQLHQLSKTDDANRWTQMAEIVDDEVVTTFAVVAEPERAGAEIAKRYAGIADRYWFYTPYEIDSGLLEKIAREVRGMGAD